MTQQNRTVACADCAKDRTAVPNDAPCPACGSTAKNTSVTLNDFSEATDQIDELEVRPDQQPHWWEQWDRVQRALDRLREAYEPSASLSLDDLRRRVDEIFLGCWSLGDWLINDDQITPRVTRADIDGATTASTALTVCRGYANTAKHKTRTKPTHLEAHISSFKQRPDGNRVLVTSRSQIQPPVEQDALRLAEQCVVAWQRFLATRGLYPPAI